MRPWHRSAAILLLAMAVMGQTVVPPQAPVKGKPGTAIALFNGKNLDGWTWLSGTAASKMNEVWTVKDGVLRCAAAPTGYIATEKEYRNFILTLEYRHITAANGGTFICIHGSPKVWPDGIQIQGNFGHVGDLLNQNSGMKQMTTDPGRTRKVNKDIVATRLALPADSKSKAENALGEWNTLVITMEEGNLSVTNNGALLNTAKEVAPDSGKIGIQAEGAVMEFRKVELTPLE